MMLFVIILSDPNHLIAGAHATPFSTSCVAFYIFVTGGDRSQIWKVSWS